MSATEAMRILAHERAGFFNSLLPLSAMIATPLFGLLSDKIGKRAFLMMFGSILLMPVYLMMGYTNVSLYLPVCMMGVAFSLIPAVMWPSVAYIVDQNRLGTAYALMTLIQQIGFFLLELADRHGQRLRSCRRWITREDTGWACGSSPFSDSSG